MSTKCIPLGDAITSGRPFVYLPETVQNAIAAEINSLVKGCVSCAFTRVSCAQSFLASGARLAGQRESSDESRSEPCETASAEGGRKCWHRGALRYYPDGVVEIKLDLSLDGASAGIEGLLRLKADIKVSAVGPVLNLITGHEAVQFHGDCPSGCEDEWVSGKLACEITGEISVSSNLLTFWNVAAAFNFVLAASAPYSLLGTIEAIKDLIDPAGAKEDFFQHKLIGNGPNQGAVYVLGPFELRAP